MAQDFYETPHGESILDAYNRGRLDGLTLALRDPDKARAEIAEGSATGIYDPPADMREALDAAHYDPDEIARIMDEYRDWTPDPDAPF